MKILHFTIAASRGGQTQYILNLSKRMNKSIFKLGFITFNEEMKCAEDFMGLGTIHYIPFYPEKDRESFIECFNEILDQGYDILELHTTSWKSLLVEELAKERGIKRVIVHAHAASINLGINDVGRIGYQEALDLHNRIRNDLSENIATDFWACSKKASQWLFGDKIPESKIEIINNPINVEEFGYSGKKRELLRKEKKVENMFVLGFVGRLEKVKNAEYAIKIAKKLHAIYPKIVLYIIGEGTQREELVEKYRPLIDKQIISFEGYKKNVCDYYHIFDVLLVPSYSEGLPIALIEAQATGLKCLCSEGVPEEVDISGNVTRLSLYNESKWVNEIQKLLAGYNRTDMKDKIIKAGLDMESQVNRIERLYLEETDNQYNRTSV